MAENFTFRVYRGNTIAPEPPPILVVEVRQGESQFWVGSYLWAGDEGCKVGSFPVPSAPAADLDSDFAFEEAVRRVTGNLNAALFKRREASGVQAIYADPVYSLAETKRSELARLRDRGQTSLQTLLLNARCPALREYVEQLMRLSWD